MLSDVTFNLTQNNQGFALVGSYGFCNISFNGNFGGGKIAVYTGDYNKIIPFTADISPLKITNASIDLTKIPNNTRGYFRFAQNTSAYNKFKYPFVKTENDITNPSTDFTPKNQISLQTLKEINFTETNANLEFVSLDCISELQIKELKPAYKDIGESPMEISTAMELVDLKTPSRVTYYKVEGTATPNIEVTLYDIHSYHYLIIT